VRTAAALVALLTFAPTPAPQLQPPQVIVRHFVAAGSRYQYVPFEVAAGTAALTIGYQFSGDDGSSVIDLGLLEPGPTTLGTPAFRGYSGGSQKTITISRNNASPGYRTGPLPAGTWHIMLGLYRVAPGGVDVEITITEGHDAPGPEGPGLRSVAEARTPSPQVGRDLLDPPGKRNTPNWYSGALHLHTNHSDGSLAPSALADTARDAGYDFIAITDHNNTTHTREPLPPSPLHITGEELTTPGGHATVIGLPDGAWIDFRVSPRDPHAAESIADLVAQAHKAGALFIVSHPVDTCGGCSWDHAVPGDIDGVEIWQNDKAPRDAEVAFWDRLLLAGRHVTAVGVSDWHRPGTRIDMAAVRVLADSLAQSPILDGIRRGHVIVMRDAATDPPTVRVSCGSQSAGIGDTLTCGVNDALTMRIDAPHLHGGDAAFIWNAARLTSKPIDGSATFTMPAARGYLRAHLYAADHSPVAITNPVYVEIR
jgi:hypothetical protein